MKSKFTHYTDADAPIYVKRRNETRAICCTLVCDADHTNDPTCPVCRAVLAERKRDEAIWDAADPALLGGAMSEVTHQECGGTVMFERRRLDGEEQASTVLVCRRCSTVITATSQLHPQGAICGVALRDTAA